MRTGIPFWIRKVKEMESLNVYSVDKIRNVCVMGHGGEGKTSLIESMLYMTKATDRMGKIADGNTVCDYDPEEIRRKFSISTAVAPVEYGDCKINMLDTPGFFDFEGEVQSALRVCESGLIVVPGKSGPSVGTEKAWKRLADQGKPCAFYISKLTKKIPIMIHRCISCRRRSAHTLFRSLSRFSRATARPSALSTVSSARRTTWRATNARRLRFRKP